jgi:hypothetical protein
VNERKKERRRRERERLKMMTRGQRGKREGVGWEWVRGEWVGLR